uniref:Reverse transcriptase domain-containing protein n=1 Tax=Astyanax mexicanus TaxID=7994 RepID=A0A3B1KHQ9_ASTMX
MDTFNILSYAQSGFRQGHGCVTASLKVLNDIISALDKKQSCAAIFIDLAKAFDTVDHSILLDRLRSIGVSEQSLAWFASYLIGRVQRVRSEHFLSESHLVTKGVPQGSILGPTLFSIYINNLALCVKGSSIHLYADDTVLYATGPSPEVVSNLLQNNFVRLQQAFCTLKLQINTTKTKVLWFDTKGFVPHPHQDIVTLEGDKIGQVNEYKYLGIWLDNTLSFSTHINKLQSNVKSKIGYLYRTRSSLSRNTKLTLVQMTILPMFDYGDVVYRSACKSLLHKLDVLYHSAIRFAINAPFKTHHCSLYSAVSWPSLHIRRLSHWYMLIYKTLVGLSPQYLSSLLQYSSSSYNTRSAHLIMLQVPKMKTSLGLLAFQAAAANDWNLLQKTLKLDLFISMSDFKKTIAELLNEKCCCHIA